jgi:mRNA interferase YafQ
MKKHKRKTVTEFFEVLKKFENTVYAIDVTGKFKKDVKLAYSRNLNLELLENVIYILAKGEKLGTKHSQHKLTGYKIELWECHISSDWLMTWYQNDNELIVLLVDTGTHSDLFG